MQEQEVSYIAMSDERLVGVLYELVAQVDDEELAQELESALSEAFERFALEPLRQDTWRTFQEEAEPAREMDDWLAGVQSRAAFRPFAQQLGES